MEGLADLISHFFNGIDPKPTPSLGVFALQFPLS
jgi:hypothetical protein